MNDEIISAYYCLLHDNASEDKLSFHTMLAGQLIEKGVYIYEYAKQYIGTKKTRHKKYIHVQRSVLSNQCSR